MPTTSQRGAAGRQLPAAGRGARLGGLQAGASIHEVLQPQAAGSLGPGAAKAQPRVPSQCWLLGLLALSKPGLPDAALGQGTA